jgi:hypothetical protein
MRLSVLICSTVALALLQSETVTADKMHPEMMSHKRRPGLNAMVNCRRPRFNICQGCSITIRMRVPQNGTESELHGTVCGARSCCTASKWHLWLRQRDRDRI